MSHLDARFATNIITIWRPDTNSFNGDEEFTLIGTFDSTWKNSATLRADNAGNQFMPKGIYTLDCVEDIRRNDVLARGIHTDVNPITAGFSERVKIITEMDGSFFNWDNSMQLVTG